MAQVYLGYEQITVSNSVLDVDDLTIPDGTVAAELQAETQDVRYTMDDSTDPAQGSGMILIAGGEIKEFLRENLNRIRMIRGAGSNAKLNIHYSGPA